MKRRQVVLFPRVDEDDLEYTDESLRALAEKIVPGTPLVTNDEERGKIIEAWVAEAGIMAMIEYH